MEITNHGYERYCERVLNIPEKEIKTYLDQNKNNVREELLSLYDSSTYLHTNTYYEQKIAHFYIVGDLLIVINEAKQAIVTVYYIDFGFSKRINMTIIDDLVKEINSFNKQKEVEIPLNEENIISINVRLEGLQKQIDSLKKQIELLEDNKNCLEQSKRLSNTKILMIDENIKQLASKLCYSINYKLDGLKKK